MTVPTELDERFRAAAAAEGLLDVAYDLVDTPLGALLVAATPTRPLPDLLRRRSRARGGAARPRLRAARAALAARGRRRAPPARRLLRGPPARRSTSASTSRRSAPSTATVLDELAASRTASMTTYGALAAQAGRPRAARAVGTAMNRNPIPIVLPCHRVVGSTGRLVGYGGGLERKEQLLRLEGALLG